MKTALNIVVVMFFGVCFAVMMHVKNDVQQLEKEQRALVAEQMEIQENLKVLKAEYAHLSRPERLWKLAADMGFQEAEPYQVVAVGFD